MKLINKWNELPQEVVDALTINAFKNRLDRDWADMGVFSWPALQPINIKYK